MARSRSSRPRSLALAGVRAVPRSGSRKRPALPSYERRSRSLLHARDHGIGRRAVRLRQRRRSRRLSRAGAAARRCVAASTGGNRLFRNDLIGPGSRGVLHFTDVTDQARVGLSAVGMGVAVGDIDNDGWRDLYVTNFGSNVLYRNNGDGTFSDVTAAAGVDDPALEHERGVSRLRPRRRSRSDRRQLRGVHRRRRQGLHGSRGRARLLSAAAPTAPVPARLFRNDGAGQFTDVTDASGVSRAYGAGSGCRCRRLRRRRLARHLRRQRRDGEPAVDQSAKRHLRRSRISVGDGRECGRPARRQHGHRARRFRTTMATKISSSPTSPPRRMPCT